MLSDLSSHEEKYEDCDEMQPEYIHMKSPEDCKDGGDVEENK